MQDQPSSTDFKEDSQGQLELTGIDTPMGEKAEIFIQADARFKTATEARDLAMIELIGLMKQDNIRTLKYKGDTMQYQPGHLTPEKIKFVPSNA